MKKILHYLIAWAAYWFYGRPGRKLIVVGVTGTKGKSTACRLIASALESAGKVGMLTTVEFQVADKRWANDKKMTMLGRGRIQKMLAEMVKGGCRFAVVETSSEGIAQFRHHYLHYDVAVFMNLGTEHSERHGGFENLKKAKGQLFAELSKHKKIIGGQAVPKVIVANADSEHVEYFKNFSADKKITFGLRAGDLKAEIKNSGADGVQFAVGAQNFSIKLVGEFNVYNALAAIAVARSQGIGDEKIAAGLAGVNQVAGRMEFINEGQEFDVIVDYAHEPLSFTELFTALRKLVGSDKKVISVIGSDGGGRDVSKRAKMGEIAGRLTDFVVVTDVNCFDEDPRAIAEMLASGARQAGKKDNENLFIEVDRRKGIEKAISLAQAGDVVAITAKGTELVICVAGGKRIPWDDRQVARESIKKYVAR